MIFRIGHFDGKMRGFYLLANQYKADRLYACRGKEGL